MPTSAQKMATAQSAQERQMSIFLGEAFELRGYFVVITTARRPDGWWAWAEFEQDIEWGERSIPVPVYRHRVPGTFASRSVSVEAGCEYAHQILAEGTVVIH